MKTMSTGAEEQGKFHYSVCPSDEPLRAGGRSCSGHHVVVPALEDCTPDLRRGVVTVRRWGREVVV